MMALAGDELETLVSESEAVAPSDFFLRFFLKIKPLQSLVYAKQTFEREPNV